MADAEWRLRRCRMYQEELLTARIEEIRPAHPGASSIALQALAYDALHRESGALAQLMRYEVRFQSQYDKAYRAWGDYQRVLDSKQNRDLNLQIKATLAAPLPLPAATAPAPRLSNEPNLPAVTNEPNATTARNAPCPCGSGQKYKRCCGHNAPAILNTSAA
jgi:hypothetical protein